MKVLVAVNEPEFADLICKAVTSNSWNEDTEFTVVSVIEPLKIGSISAVLPGPILDDLRTRNQEQASEMVNKAAKAIGERFPSATVSKEVIEGLAAEAILEFAESWKADLIVLGSHSRPALSRVFLGSVSLAVASKATCSVMIVKPHASNSKDKKRH